jgi:hypothetical protein
MSWMQSYAYACQHYSLPERRTRVLPTSRPCGAANRFDGAIHHQLTDTGEYGEMVSVLLDGVVFGEHYRC